MSQDNARARAGRCFYLATLGCKVNQYENQALREAWAAAGFTESPHPDRAGLIVIHTCAVTANAVADARAMTRRLHKEAPDAAIYLMGCAAEACPAELAALPGVVRVVQRRDKTAFITQGPQGPDLSPHNPAESDLAAPLPLLAPLAGAAHNDIARPAQGIGPDAPLFPRLSISRYHRARPVVKLQDGCSHGCTYCIVPLTRGRSVSRPPEDILAEMTRLHEAGFAELILSGINLRQYGRDFPKTAPIRDFWTLLAWLEECLYPRLYPNMASNMTPDITPNITPAMTTAARWRLSSLEPGQLNAAALDVLSRSRLIAPHLHISLQSGSPDVLKRMGRGHYQPETLPDFLNALRRHWPVMGLGADILMGFPGESEAEFAHTHAFIASLPLTYAHVFPFSPRPGTAAATMPGHLPRELAEERAAAIRALTTAKKDAFLRFLLTRPEHKLRMLLESRATGLGVSEYYASCRLPEADIPADAQAGQIIAVRPTALDEGKLLVSLA